jgi:hypothetical protein
MHRERFRVYDDPYQDGAEEEPQEYAQITPSSLRRRVAAPWWIIDIIVKASRYTRDCPNIDRGASIRGSIKALDHTYSTTEMRGARVSSLEDALRGLNLSLRGRIRLRADLMGFDDRPSVIMARYDEVVEDVMHYAVRDVGERVLAGVEVGLGDLAREVEDMLYSEGGVNEGMGSHPALSEVLGWMDESTPEASPHLVDELEDQLRASIEGTDPATVEEYRLCGLEFIANALVSTKAVSAFTNAERAFFPKRMES